MEYHPHCEAEGNHRFALEQEGNHVLFVIGLNPSTADGEKPDQTMRRVISIAEANGYDGYVMLNLSSERATRPKDMAPNLDGEMHRKNMSAISRYAEKYPGADVLLAFGNNIERRNYLSVCFNDILETLSHEKRHWLRVGGPKGITAHYHPMHPLFAKIANGLEPFDAVGYCRMILDAYNRKTNKDKQ